MSTAEKLQSDLTPEQRLEALREALWYARWSKVLLLGLTLVISVSFIYVLYLAPATLPFDREKLLAKAQERLEANAETIVAEASDFAADTVPPISKAMFQEMKRDVPVYLSALEDQGGELANDLKTHFKDSVRERYKTFLTKHRNVFEEEFPDLAKGKTLDKLMARFEKTFDRLVSRYYLDEFQGEITHTAELWKSIPPAKLPEGVSASDQLLRYVSDWAVLKAKGGVLTKAGLE